VYENTEEEKYISKMEIKKM